MGQSQTKQVSGELERLLLELRRELVEEEGETAADIVDVLVPKPSFMRISSYKYAYLRSGCVRAGAGAYYYAPWTWPWPWPCIAYR